MGAFSFFSFCFFSLCFFSKFHNFAKFVRKFKKNVCFFNYCSWVSVNVPISKLSMFSKLFCIQKCLGISKSVPAFQICSQIYKMFMFSNFVHKLQKKNRKFHKFVWEFEKMFPFQNSFENFKKCSYLEVLFGVSKIVLFPKLFANFKKCSFIKNLFWSFRKCSPAKVVHVSKFCFEIWKIVPVQFFG